MKTYLICTLLLFSLGLNAQQKPEKEYFQQNVKYEIEVIIDVHRDKLLGNYHLDYKNNSRDTLNELYFHIYPAAYGNTASDLAQEYLFASQGLRSVYFASEEKPGGISELNFVSPGQELFSLRVKPDIVMIKLQKPLLPGSSIKINTKFNIDIPAEGFSRMGMKDQNYQLTQWFPKPAVYDSKGWHLIPNRNVGEFYGEFGSFDVKLMVPEEYISGFTGELIKTERWKPAHIPGWKPEITENIKYKTLFITAENVHTFAWCTGKDYKKMEKTLNIPSAGKKVNAHILYIHDEDRWKKQFPVIRDALEFYSHKIGAYPYPQVTVAETISGSGGGMEYPMFTLVDKLPGISQEVVIMHEIGHNWFYGALGFNEREYPWMDEGLNSFYESLYINRKYPGISLQKIYLGDLFPSGFMGMHKLRYEDLHYLIYRSLAAKNLDLPLTYTSGQYNEYEYFANTYFKASVLFRYLYFLEGEAKFDAFMQSFWEKWKFQHPQPEDFYAHLKAHYPEKGRWFVKEMLTTTKHADYKIKKLKTSNDSVEVLIKNKGKLAADFDFQFETPEGQKKKIRVKGFKNTKRIKLKTLENGTFKIDPAAYLPETNRNNNEYRGSRLSPKADKLSLKWLYHLPAPEEQFLFHTPLLGYNMTDGLMPGWLFYNDPVFSVPFRFRLSSFYSFSSNEINGEGRISYTAYEWDEKKQFQLSVYGKKYGAEHMEPGDNHSYFTLKPELSLYLKGKHNTFIKSMNKITLRYNFLREDNYLNSYSDYHVYEMDAVSRKRTISHERVFNVNMQYYRENLKISGEYKYDLFYGTGNQSLTFRAFAGKFLSNGIQDLDMRFRLSSWTGDKDYLYQHTMLDRNFGASGNDPDRDQVLSHQMIRRDGGFVAQDYALQSWDFVYALNVHAHLPFTKPLGLLGIFGSIGDFGLPAPANNTGSYKKIYTEAGVSLSLWKEYIRIFLPLYYSGEFIKSPISLPLMRFTLNLDKLNPFKPLQTIDPTFM